MKKEEYFTDILLLSQLLLAFLRLAGIIHWPLWIIFTPTLIYGLFFFSAMIAMIIGIGVGLANMSKLNQLMGKTSKKNGESNEEKKVG